MMRQIVFLSLLAFLAVATATARAQEFDHALGNRILKNHVTRTRRRTIMHFARNLLARFYGTLVLALPLVVAVLITA